MNLAPFLYFYPGTGYDAPEGVNANAIIIDGPEKMIIDPGLGSRWPERAAAIRADGLDPAGLTLALFTHSHPDHMEAGLILERDYGTTLALHRLEREYLAGGGGLFFPDSGRFAANRAFRFLEEGSLAFGGHGFQLFLTPGHSPGGLSLYWPEGRLLVAGDLYFPGTIGAFDLPGGRPRDMYDSIERVEALAGVETVVCGHCPPIFGRGNIEANYGRLRAEIAEKKAAGFI